VKRFPRAFTNADVSRSPSSRAMHQMKHGAVPCRAITLLPTTGVTIASWDVLPNHGAESLRTVARTGDDVHGLVIAYARGDSVAHPALQRRYAGRCFAALRPDGWKALPGAEHHAWIEKRSDLDVPLAVRVREVRLDVRTRLGTDGWFPIVFMPCVCTGFPLLTSDPPSFPSR
jgi:hypothetical protein